MTPRQSIQRPSQDRKRALKVADAVPPSAPNRDLAPGYFLALGLAAALERESFPPGWPPELCRGALLLCTKGTNQRSSAGDVSLCLRGLYRVVAVIPHAPFATVVLEDTADPSVWVRLVASPRRMSPGVFDLHTDTNTPCQFTLARHSYFEVPAPSATLPG